MSKRDKDKFDRMAVAIVKEIVWLSHEFLPDYAKPRQERKLAASLRRVDRAAERRGTLHGIRIGGTIAAVIKGQGDSKPDATLRMNPSNRHTRASSRMNKPKSAGGRGK